MRTPRKSSSSRPSASVGWTSVSGASERASDLQRPAEQRERGRRRPSAAFRTSWPISDGAQRMVARRTPAPRSPGGRSRSRSSRRRPAPARSRGGRRRAHHCAPSAIRARSSSRVGAAAAALVGPGARAARARRWPRRCASPRRVDGLPGVALTFDDGPHPEGTPAVLDALGAGAARARPSSSCGEQVRRDPALRARDRRGRARGGPARLPPPLPAAPGPAGARGRPRARARGDRPTPPDVRAGALPPALRDLQHRRPGARAPPRLARPAVVALGPRLARRARPPRRSRPRRRATCAPGDVLLLHDADHYSEPGVVARTAQALPAVLEAIERGGPRAVAL